MRLKVMSKFMYKILLVSILILSVIINVSDATENAYDEIGPNGLGDINNDGIINEVDLDLIQKFATHEIELSEEQKARADVNKDGNVTIKDATIIQKYIELQNLYDEIGDQIYIYNEIGPNGLGDINDDGIISGDDPKLIQKFVNHEFDNSEMNFTEKQKSRADVNKDGSINIKDITVIEKYIELQNLYDEIRPNAFDKIGPNGLGDINNDGIISEVDSNLIQKFATRKIEYTEGQKLRADINKDGNITIEDATALEKYIESIKVEKNIEKIEIKSRPSKTEYKVGDDLNTEGLILTATYSDESTEEITEGYNCTPTKLETEGTQTIVVTYKGKETNFEVTVKSNNENGDKGNKDNDGTNNKENEGNKKTNAQLSDIATKELPNTGGMKEIIIIGFAIIFLSIGIISYKKYKKMKDIVK